MNSVNSLVIPIFGLIFLGFFAARMRPHHERGLDWLNTFVLYFALPSLFYKLLSQTPFDQLTNWPFILATTICTFIIFSVTIIISVYVGKANLDESAIRGTAAAYGNIGYMGPGIALGALGTAAAVPTTLIICFDNLVFFAAVPFLIALGSKGRESMWSTAVGIAKRVFLHPFIVASILGVTAAYFQFRAPEPILKLLDYLSSAAAPCALFALGVTIAGQPLRRVSMDIPLLLIAKLILQPILVFIVLTTFLEPDPVWLLTAVLLASLPPAANVFVLATQYGVYIERASSTILIGTIISIITVTAVLYLIQENIIP